MRCTWAPRSAIPHSSCAGCTRAGRGGQGGRHACSRWDASSLLPPELLCKGKARRQQACMPASCQQLRLQAAQHSAQPPTSPTTHLRELAAVQRLGQVLLQEHHLGRLPRRLCLLQAVLRRLSPAAVPSRQQHLVERRRTHAGSAGSPQGRWTGLQAGTTPLTAAAPAHLRRWPAALTAPESLSQTPRLQQHQQHTFTRMSEDKLVKLTSGQGPGMPCNRSHEKAQAATPPGVLGAHPLCAPAGGGPPAWWWPSAARCPSP